jgi:hypothetical protein
MILSLLRAGGSSSVVVFTVHEPPNPPSDRVDRAEELVFVKDGFTWLAALVPPLWFVTNRLWLELVGYVVITWIIAGGLSAIGLEPQWVTLLILALQLFLGFEASTIKRAALSRRGYAQLGIVTGRNTTDCERRFFDEWLPSQPVIASLTRGSPPSSSSSGGTASDLRDKRWRGLFDAKA